MLSMRRINRGRSAINQKNKKGEKCNATNQKNQKGKRNQIVST